MNLLPPHFRRGWSQRRSALILALLWTAPLGAAATTGLDLSNASVVLAPEMSGPERKAVQMLIEEARKRSRISWAVSERGAESGHPLVYIGQREALRSAYPDLDGLLGDSSPRKAEGYRIVTTASGNVVVAGNDPRGVLYGAGRLLRLMEYARDRLVVAAGLVIETAPVYALRGHQLGYRPKTNSYDGWDVDAWESYVRDLVIFGANAIEGMPPRTDDAPDSPHFPRSQIEMLIEQSRIARDYGIDFW